MAGGPQQAQLPEACTGIPGDLANPNANGALPAATHGPGITPAGPMKIAATGGPPYRATYLMQGISMLYAYDDAGRFAMDLEHVDPALGDPIFEQMAKHAFWGEVEGGQYWSIPWVSTCDQARMLGNDFVFRAPSKGLLLLQYRLPHCEACDKVDAAIERVIAMHPQLPVRWVQFDLASTQTHSRWCYNDYVLNLHENLNREYLVGMTCPR